jgi:putative membrane protein
MNFLLHLLLDAAVIFGMAYVLPQVEVKNFGTAVLIALLLGVFNWLIGWLIRAPLNLITFYALTGIIRIVVMALLLKLIDRLMKDFSIQGFWPALLIAVVVAVAGGLIDSQSPTESMRTNIVTTK